MLVNFFYQNIHFPEGANKLIFILAETNMVHKYVYLDWISFEGEKKRIASHWAQKNVLHFNL